MRDVLCNGISITECFETGFLGGPHSATFTFTQDGLSYSVSVEQIGIRHIQIYSEGCRPMDEYLQLFNALDMLLMLADGEFVPIKSAAILQGAAENNSEELNDWLKHRLSLFCSADFTRGSFNRFIGIDAVLTANIFENWLKIREDLDILHQMVLYSMADTGMPIDCKCAFIIESFKALSELLCQHITTFAPSPKSLRNCLDAVIQAYGQDIFSAEYANGKDSFLSILVNSRNRIAHIKSQQDKNYLTGPESVLYAVKLSFLYRRVLLELLDVDYSGYQDTLKESIQSWNEWNGILDGFLNKLT